MKVAGRQMRSRTVIRHLEYIAADNPVRAANGSRSSEAAASSRFPIIGRPGVIPGTRELFRIRATASSIEVRDDAIWILAVVHTSRQWPPVEDETEWPSDRTSCSPRSKASSPSAVLALTALGLSLVFGVMRVVNVAHGEFFMLGAVLAWADRLGLRRPSGDRLPRRAGRQPADRRRGRACSPSGWCCAG